MRLFQFTALMLSCSLPLLAGGHAEAQTPAPVTMKPVIELFTSQGCSSCPPADALLRKLADKGDVIALSFAVDYWDYLGWRDTLASPRYSERQRAYARHRKDGMIYTPQVVVNGRLHVNGSRHDEIERAIVRTAGDASQGRVAIKVSKENDKIVISADAARSGQQVKEMTLWLAVFQHNVEVPVLRGENRGRTLVYTNVVRDLIPVGMWQGQAMTVRLDKATLIRPGVDGCAVLLQEGVGGPIVSAAELAAL